MIARHLCIAIIVGVLVTGPRLNAQTVADCDSTVFVSDKLARTIDVRSELAPWIGANTLVNRPDSAKQIKNGRDVARELVHNYPPRLRDRNIGGETVFVILVDTAGAVAKYAILETSGYADLDRAASSTISSIKFVPFRTSAGCAVPAVWQLPIRFWTQ